MSDPTSPKAWANFLVRAWGPNFPIKVPVIALEYSKRFADPIVKVAAAEVESFEGAIYFREKTQAKADRWFILYNPKISSAGRINFTIAHELGHYLCHRTLIRVGPTKSLECSQRSVLGIDTDTARNVEREADIFASYLLMPMDDFRQQINGHNMSIDLLAHCADRYDVSLTAAAMKWIEFTDERAILVIGIDGFVLWSRSSGAALNSYIYFKKGSPLPESSVAVKGRSADSVSAAIVEHPPGVWCRERVNELTTFADKYELTISLLILDRIASSTFIEEAEPELDTFDLMSLRSR